VADEPEGKGERPTREAVAVGARIVGDEPSGDVVVSESERLVPPERTQELLDSEVEILADESVLRGDPTKPRIRKGAKGATSAGPVAPNAAAMPAARGSPGRLLGPSPRPQGPLTWPDAPPRHAYGAEEELGVEPTDLSLVDRFVQAMLRLLGLPRS
jgi:hypothetical protein